MTMGPRLRKAALVVHILCSVGWVGAVVVFVGLAGIGLTSQDPATVRGTYLVMEPAARLVLLPLALASLVTGLIQSLGTTWGLVRHYWVIFKLLINVMTTVVLFMYMETFAQMSAVAADPAAELTAVRSSSPSVHAGAALLLLIVAVLLSVYKPQGIRMAQAAGVAHQGLHRVTCPRLSTAERT